MRSVRRQDVAAPPTLTEADGPGERELKAVRAHRSDAAKRDKTYDFKAYKHDDVKAALEKLFHGKCAYCETAYASTAPVDVEHFRPKAAVEDAPGHPGYWWLAMAWDNLLPSCIDCNRRRRQATPTNTTSLADLNARAVLSTGKKDAFPILANGHRAADEGADLAAEQALLLDPTRDNPAAHLRFHLDPADPLGLVLPRELSGANRMLPAGVDAGAIAAAAAEAGVSQRGAVSIQVYGLNRLGLVQERTRVLRQLEFLRHVIVEIDATIDGLSKSRAKAAKTAATRLGGLVERIVSEIVAMAEPDRPYSALVAQWIEAYRAELEP